MEDNLECRSFPLDVVIANEIIGHMAVPKIHYTVVKKYEKIFVQVYLHCVQKVQLFSFVYDVNVATKDIWNVSENLFYLYREDTLVPFEIIASLERGKKYKMFGISRTHSLMYMDGLLCVCYKDMDAGNRERHLFRVRFPMDETYVFNTMQDIGSEIHRLAKTTETITDKPVGRQESNLFIMKVMMNIFLQIDNVELDYRMSGPYPLIILLIGEHVLDVSFVYNGSGRKPTCFVETDNNYSFCGKLAKYECLFKDTYQGETYFGLSYYDVNFTYRHRTLRVHAEKHSIADICVFVKNPGKLYLSMRRLFLALLEVARKK